MAPAMVPTFDMWNVSEHFGGTGDLLLDFGSKHACHGVFHLFDGLVDYRVEADLDTVALGGTAGCELGRTWKPMMMASEAAARVTSLSEISPTALWSTLTCTSRWRA